MDEKERAKLIDGIMQLFKKIEYLKHLNQEMARAQVLIYDSCEKFFGPDLTIRHAEFEDVEAVLCRIMAIIELMNKDGVINGDVILKVGAECTNKYKEEFDKLFNRKREELNEYYRKHDDG